MRAVLRDLDRDDHPAVAAIWRATGQQALPQDELEAVLRHGPGLVLVADEPGTGVVGVVVGTLDGRRGWIHRLAVHPAHRRAGLATGPVAELERRPTALGAPRTDLLLPDNAAGPASWRHLGHPPQPDVLCSKPVPTAAPGGCGRAFPVSG